MTAYIYHFYKGFLNFTIFYSLAVREDSQEIIN